MTCPRCERKNADERRFCGGCGASLERACAACAFVNDADDRFCGGCGLGLADASTRIAQASPGGVAMLSIDEVRALLCEIALPASTDAAAGLPDGAIGQDDLDRLFGGIA